MNQLPEAIIITISQQYMLDKGYRNWLRNFLWTMNAEEAMEKGYTYWFRTGNKPKHQVEWIYLCIGGYVRWRCTLFAVEGPGYMSFSDGRSLYAKAWLVAVGPAMPAPHKIRIQDVLPGQKNSGFQGFRYTQKIF